MKGILSILFISFLIASCSKDEGEPVNPYDLIDYGIDDGTSVTFDPDGIVSIHKEILLPKCSTPGCHDGSFEPDFRTVMSSYSTLVYHPIIKNDPDSQYFFRVIPYDTVNSVFQKRLNWQTFANTNDRMPQDNIGTGLPQEDLDRISAWILNGAKDPEGYVSQLPNLQPYANWVWTIQGAENIYDIWQSPINALSGLDNRVNNSWNEPMIVDKEMWLFLIPDIVDDSTAIKDLVNVNIELSYDKDFSSVDFTSVGTYTPPNGDDGDNWYFNFKLPASLSLETQIFLRVTMNDGDHNDDSSYPRDFANDWDKNVASIIIKEGSHL